MYHDALSSDAISRLIRTRFKSMEKSANFFVLFFQNRVFSFFLPLSRFFLLFTLRHAIVVKVRTVLALGCTNFWPGGRPAFYPRKTISVRDRERKNRDATRCPAIMSNIVKKKFAYFSNHRRKKIFIISPPLPCRFF